MITCRCHVPVGGHVQVTTNCIMVKYMHWCSKLSSCDFRYFQPISVDLTSVSLLPGPGELGGDDLESEGCGVGDTMMTSGDIAGLRERDFGEGGWATTESASLTTPTSP